LGFENRIKPFHALDFYDHGIFDQQVKSIFPQRSAFLQKLEKQLAARILC
jgi:hypothetical protein